MKWMIVLLALCAAPAFAQDCDVYGNCNDHELQNPMQQIFSLGQEEESEKGSLFTQENKPSPAFNDSEKILSGTVRLEEDRLGRAVGRIGDEPTTLYTDRLGRTTGTIGDRRVTTYTDRMGNISGQVGDERLMLFQNRVGGYTGTIGDQRVHCSENRLGTTNCY